MSEVSSATSSKFGLYRIYLQREQFDTDPNPRVCYKPRGRPHNEKPVTADDGSKTQMEIPG